MTDRPDPTTPPPTLAEAMANMTNDATDIMGRMVHGHRWPEVKAQHAEATEARHAEAERQARYDRLATRVRQLVVLYLLTALVAVAAAAVVLAWRVAL